MWKNPQKIDILYAFKCLSALAAIQGTDSREIGSSVSLISVKIPLNRVSAARRLKEAIPSLRWGRLCGGIVE